MATTRQGISTPAFAAKLEILLTPYPYECLQRKSPSNHEKLLWLNGIPDLQCSAPMNSPKRKRCAAF